MAEAGAARAAGEAPCWPAEHTDLAWASSVRFQTLLFLPQHRQLVKIEGMANLLVFTGFSFPARF